MLKQNRNNAFFCILRNIYHRFVLDEQRFHYNKGRVKQPFPPFSYHFYFCLSQIFHYIHIIKITDAEILLSGTILGALHVFPLMYPTVPLLSVIINEETVRWKS